MVNKKIIEKLSDKELENYIKPESRFVSEAIKCAFGILKERGKSFSESESERILNLIETKKEIENRIEPINDSWDKNLIKEASAIELYTNRLIWVFSIFFGVIFGTVLQISNFVKIKNSKGIYLSLAFGIIYTIFQLYALNYIEENFLNLNTGKSTLTYLFSGIGAYGLFYIRESLFPKKIEYRAKSFIVPLIIAIIIYIPVIYVIITFSGN